MTVHYCLPDTQCKPGVDLSYLEAIGKHILDVKPDVIIHLGDHFDMPSLSTYDKGKVKAEGSRIHEDLKAGDEGMELLLKAIKSYNKKQKKNKKKQYKPRLVFTCGNHEYRLLRHAESNPELHGLLTYDTFDLDKYGWEVYPFLQPVTIDGVSYAHYFYNPKSGRPYGGMATTKLKNIGHSFTQGHTQGLDYATRCTPDGNTQCGLVVGSSYPHEEEYIGPQGNHHWRGVVVCRNVEGGRYDPEFISTQALVDKYL